MLIGLSAGTVATFVLLWLTDWPLGVPGEWTWDRSALSSDAVWLIVVAACIAGSYAAGVAWALPRIGDSAARTAALLILLTLGGLAVTWTIDSTAQWPRGVPPEDRAGDRADLKRALTVYDAGVSGYFQRAAKSDETTGEFLAGYEAEMAKGDYLHVGTHPPGLILLHRGLLSLCRSSPGIADAVLATQPRAVTEAFAAVERGGRLTSPRMPASNRAALWLATLLTYVVAALTVVPLYFLVRGDFGPRAAAMTAAFWPFLPALAIFLPKSDALFPFLGLLFVWCWRSALRRRSFVLAVTAGVVMWCGLLLSLALLPVALFAVLLTFWETFGKTEGDTAVGPKAGLLLAVTAVASFAVATLAFSWSTGANLPAIWRWNFLNHARFYDHNERTWWKWLPVNATELAFAVGWPIILLAAVRVTMIVRGGELRRRINGPVFSGLAVIALLWLSGKNMGEAARLWLFLTPWLLWMTAGVWDRASTGQPAPRTWLAVLAFQFAVCLITVLRVTGITFAGM